MYKRLYSTFRKLSNPLISVKSWVMLGIVATALSGLLACQGPPEFPNTPTITFKNIDYVRGRERDSIIVAVDFTDGDGDLGVGPTEQPNEFNIFVDFFIKKNGSYERVNFPSNTTYNGRFPRIKETDDPAPLQGTIKYTMSSFNFPFYRNDTIKLHVTIRDRAGNMSNMVESSELRVP